MIFNGRYNQNNASLQVLLVLAIVEVDSIVVVLSKTQVVNIFSSLNSVYDVRY